MISLFIQQWPVVGQMEKGGREEVGLVTGCLGQQLVNFYVDAVGQMEKGGREEVGLVTGSLGQKLVNFYVDAVDGYDDTTA